MSNIPMSSEEFKSLFHLEAHPEWINSMPMADCIGFSVQRYYPESSRYKPPVKKDGKPDTLALVIVVYEHDRSNHNKPNPNCIPISARISAHSQYFATHTDYNFEDAECPTEESVIISRKTPRPADLLMFDEYYFDHDNNQFVDTKDKGIEGISIINELYEQHLATVDGLRGVLFRWKQGLFKRKLVILGLAINYLIKLLRITCGRTLESLGNFGKGFLSEYSLIDMKLLKTDSIEIFGYKASKNIICTYCFLLILAFGIFRIKGTPSFIKTIATNNFLGIAGSILAISLLDLILPRFFLMLINFMIRIRLRAIGVRSD